MIYLTNFTNHTNYNLSKDNLSKPNISVCLEERDVYYNPYIDPYNGHDYIEIGGIKWATMNVGANSVTDTGLYFQWGDTQGYTADQVGSGEGQKLFDWANYKFNPSGDGKTMSKYNDEDDLITLQSSDDAVTAAWGGSWRMPTKEEFTELLSNTNHVWAQVDGVSGMMCTDKTDETKTLFFPACGVALSSVVISVGSNGYYWSSSLSDSGVNNGSFLNFSNNSCSTGGIARCYGYTVRGVID